MYPTITLFTNARNERNIREWAAHHLLIGFDQIIIFDHKSTIKLTSVFQNFDRRVRVIDVSYIDKPKIILMNIAATIARQMKSKYMLYLDADEFFILNESFVGIKHFLLQYPYAHSIGVNWLMFGSNHLTTEPPNGILSNYTKSDRLLNQHVKSIVRTSEVVNATNPHYYNIRNSSRMIGIDRRQVVGDKAFHNTAIMPFENAPAYIAHYINQSEETFVRRKCLLPADDSGIVRNVCNSAHIHSEHNEVENTYPKTKYSENVRKFIAQYS